MTDSILGILYWMLQLLTFALIARALLSWVDPRMEWGVSRIIVEVTDPVVAPLRRVIPPLGMIDISFLVAILLIQMLMRLIQQAM